MQVTYLSGWRLALALVLGALLALLIISTIVWLAILVAVVAAVAWLNVVLLPGVAQRLRLPRVVLDLACLALLVGVGWLLAGQSGLIAGAIGWVVGVGIPRVLGRRMRGRIQTTEWRSQDALELEPGSSQTDVWRWERRP